MFRGCTQITTLQTSFWWCEREWKIMDSNEISLEQLFNQRFQIGILQSYTNKYGRMFQGQHLLIKPLNSWDVSNITTMDYILIKTASFNQPLNSWDTS